MKTMWHAFAWFKPLITRVQVSRETPKTVTVVSDGGGRRPRVRKRQTDTGGYFDTWEDAWNFLMTHAGKEVGAARRNLELANSRLGNIKGMRRPLEADSEVTREG